MALVEVTPEELGFKKAVKKQGKNEDDVDRALDVFDRVIIPRKIAEAKKFNDILEETGGNISKQEMNELLGYGFANEILGDEPIPLNTKPMEKVLRAREEERKKNKSKSRNSDEENDQEEDELSAMINSIKTGFEDDYEDDDL